MLFKHIYNYVFSNFGSRYAVFLKKLLPLIIGSIGYEAHRYKVNAESKRTLRLLFPYPPKAG